VAIDRLFKQQGGLRHRGTESCPKTIDLDNPTDSYKTTGIDYWFRRMAALGRWPLQPFSKSTSHCWRPLCWG